MNWNKIFKKIEKHFGFKLDNWQKDYISMKIDEIPVGGRGNGKTFAYILRHLLNYEVKLGDYKYAFDNGKAVDSDYWFIFPCDEFRSAQYMRNWYPRYVIEIDQRLKFIGLETCFI